MSIIQFFLCAGIYYFRSRLFKLSPHSTTDDLGNLKFRYYFQTKSAPYICTAEYMEVTLFRGWVYWASITCV